MDHAKRLLERCDQLAQISALESGILRAYLTPEHKQANRLVAQWMQQAGMTSWSDPAGNIWGRYASASPDAKTLVIGSHLDTVPNAGRYDGIFGVLAGIELVDSLNTKRVQLPFNIDVVGFGDEEGYRFGATLLGSEAIAGGWKDSWNSLCDAGGISLEQAFVDFGLDVNDIPMAQLDAEQLIGYWELHIEQGPVLEQQDLAIGVVTGIAGARRFNFTINGFAGHAGTVPMDLRQDALAGSAEMILAIEQLAIKHGVVATVGKISVIPGAVNVIAGRAVFSLDIRSDNDQLRDDVLLKITQQAQQIAAARNLQVTIEQTHNASAVLCDADFMALFDRASKKITGSSYRLVSGAGHDAMAMDRLCKVGMLFMRCEKGISHHPAEAVTYSDTVIALQVFEQAVQELEQSISISPDKLTGQTR
ncbi:allantoate amidohydrolase [Methylophaga sp.]|uniref:allantoate amidohydrolase n=1 Tax=Methylophaga sp. TaxID=2024840 RepID=UPI002715DC8E|nr:allantoate amidohydrolase [Methylophaga sp.]MDO8826877.1 allantoate amidohydrolase [Methylophaga sp.]